MTIMNKLLMPLLMLFMLVAGGCTQNNGYIGPVFGSWSLVGISEDGNPLKLDSETVFSFQNEVVQIELIESDFQRTTKYGNFTLSEDVMTMTFLTELGPDGQGYSFLMPTWLHFPSGQMPLRFEVKTLKGSKMVLAIDNDGKTLVYTFDRTW